MNEWHFFQVRSSALLACSLETFLLRESGFHFLYQQWFVFFGIIYHGKTFRVFWKQRNICRVRVRGNLSFRFCAWLHSSFWQVLDICIGTKCTSMDSSKQRQWATIWNFRSRAQQSLEGDYKAFQNVCSIPCWSWLQMRLLSIRQRVILLSMLPKYHFHNSANNRILCFVLLAGLGIRTCAEQENWSNESRARSAGSWALHV